MSWSDWISVPTTQRLALTLLHFLWQGLVIAGGTAVLASCLEPRRAGLRYRVLVTALVLMVVCPFLTFLTLDDLSGRAPRAFSSAQESSVPDHAPPGFETRESTSPGTPGILVATPACAWIVLGWVAGVLLCAVRLSAGLIGVERLVRDVAPIPSSLESRVDELSRSLAITRLRGVFVSERTAGAIAAGFLRPVVLIPSPWLGQLSPVVLEAVIAHELAHISRGDVWVNLIQRIVETLLFYHPAVWWLSRRITIEREKCCDELAAGVLDEPVGYASALAAVARLSRLDGGALLAPGIAGRSGSLVDRVRYVLGLAPSREPLSWWLLPLVVLVASLAAAVLAIRPIAAGVDPQRSALIERLGRLESVLDDLRSSVRGLVENGTLLDVEREFAGPSVRLHADHYFDLGKYRLAARGYQVALSRHPGPRYRVELLERIREAHRRSGNLDRSIEVQEQVVEEIQPNDRYRALLTLANLHKEARRYAEAASCAERAVDAATNLGERLSGLNFRAWYIELARGEEAGLRAYEAAQRLAVSLGLADTSPAKKCRQRIERLQRILARRAQASRGHASAG